MIAATLATWTLTVQLISPILPSSIQKYSKIPTAAQCEQTAKDTWRAFHLFKHDHPSMEMQTLCVARTKAGYKWKMNIICDESMNCHTIRTEGKY